MQLRGVLRAERTATDEADERHHADDEPLPVAADRKTDADGEQDEVERVHQGCLRTGAGTTTLRSQGRLHPARVSNQSSTPAVKPHTSMSATRNAGDSRPIGCRTVTRFAGLTRSSTGTRATASTSAGDTGVTS